MVRVTTYNSAIACRLEAISEQNVQTLFFWSHNFHGFFDGSCTHSNVLNAMTPAVKLLSKLWGSQIKKVASMRVST